MALSRGTGLGGSGLSDGLPNLGGSGGEDRFDPTASFAPGANSAWDFINNYARFKDVYYGPLANTPGWSFTRASTGYAQTAAGVLVPFASGELRRTDKGVLIEGARTNLCLQSQTFDNASWTKAASSVSANTTSAPDGTTTADRIVEDGSTAKHQISQSISVTNAVTYAWSVYAKADARSRLYMEAQTSVFGTNIAEFNLATGAVVSGSGASIQALGGGWYRCINIVTATSTSSASFYCQLGNGSTNNYAGDGSSGLYLWGAQLE